jgi:hypothetical protein
VDLTESIIEAIIRLDHTAQKNIDERKYRNVSSIIKELLRNSRLTVKQLDRLSIIDLLASQKNEILQRSSVDLFSNISELELSSLNGEICGEDSMNSHAEALISLVPYLNDVSLPNEIIAYEALIHRKFLDVEITEKLVHCCRGKGSRMVAKRLEKENRIDALVTLTDIMGTLALDETAEPLAVLTALASKGSREITDRSIQPEHRQVVAYSYRPLREIVCQPEMLSVVLEVIERLDPVRAETALQLLGEWEGDLYSLVDAVAVL